MTDNLNLPGVPEPPANTFTLITELELQAYRKRLIESNGDIEKAGISLEEMRNVIYTCRMKANPMQDNPSEKEKKPKKEKTESTNKVKLSGDSVNDFLG